MKIVGITACPTGIAHTYMAAEGLEKAGRELGHSVKIETQGVETGNILTAQEIQEADLVIISASNNVDLSRFDGKKMIEVSIQESVKNPQKVMKDAISGKNSRIFRSADNGGAEKTEQQMGAGLYKHLMSGVNYMLPFVIAGGILIAFSFMFGIHASDPADPSYNVLAEALSKIGGGAAFTMMVPMLAAGIAYSIAGRQGMCPGVVAGILANNIGAGFLGGLIGALFAGYLTVFLARRIKIPKAVETLKGLIIIPLLATGITGFFMLFIVGEPIKYLLNALTLFLHSLDSTQGVLFGALIGIMMAADMGGPINKSIATFSIALMSTGVYGPVAACMVAGMTPPLGLALATTLFKKKFTADEREAGKSCWVLGLSYITEGAIPFAVADPIHVIPALMAGSAVAGAISLGSNCASLAPHGGIWILPIPNVITNLPMYILALAAGTIVTCLGLALLKWKNSYE
ncbi:PTS fructose transporter subunit IIC [Pectinatus haikarae]|uniref:PTS system fructose-specific IIC component n=1 Tax=Pectinatus haikarae TaxID=349096 RepID=A0ABT9YAG5_9FIRM|nr:fructose-specific PTS transporter subunit EIIC [Pectinatus haikarae]MDQ0204628.1 PTS system fructose-specific IIC component [Pectinatus haikarae]